MFPTLLISSLLKRVVTPTTISIHRNKYLHYSPFHSLPSSSTDDEKKTTTIHGWWDIENCGIPKEQTLKGFLKNLDMALERNNIKAKVKLTIVGSYAHMKRVLQEHSTKLEDYKDITITVTPQGKEVADQEIDQKIQKYIDGKPHKGAMVMLISCDQDFVKSLIYLNEAEQMVILVTRLDSTTNPHLMSQSKLILNFMGIVSGENTQGIVKDKIPALDVPPKKHTPEHDLWKARYSSLFPVKKQS